MPRFVILQHQLPDHDARANHWDLMLEDGGELLTWALDTQPSTDGGPIQAELLAPHRRQYLHYEGPLSGDRGLVRRWDWGSYDWRVRLESLIVVTLHGTQLQGVATLIKRQHAWLFQFQLI